MTPIPAGPVAQQATHGSEVTNIVICCRISLTDGVVMAFTSNTEDLLIDNVLYRAKTVGIISEIESTNNFAVDNLDVTGIIDSEDIKEHEILAGRYDMAEILIFTTNATDTSQKHIQRAGWIGEITFKEQQFVAEIRGLTQRLQCNVGELYTPTCRATFGDHRCKADLSQYTFSGTVESVFDRQMFTSNVGKTEGYFTSGKVVWLTGNNAGLSMEVKEFAHNRFILALSMPHAIKLGDTFNAIAGCDKLFSTCRDRFKNVINFRGEPHVPGNDKVMATPLTSNDLERQ